MSSCICFSVGLAVMVSSFVEVYPPRMRDTLALWSVLRGRNTAAPS